MFGGSTARSRDQHVTDLIEAAYQSFDEPYLNPDDEGFQYAAFNRIQAPVDPDGAAIPVLNGQVFNVSVQPIAQGDEGSAEE